MDLKVVLVIVCLHTLAITFTEAGIPKCCIKIKENIPIRTLLKVYHFEMQTSSGVCDISALVLYVRDKRKPICAHPKMKTKMMRMWQQMKQSRQKSIH